jgi:hypothetical protein
MGENKLTRNFIIGTFVLLYIMVSIISTIHVIDFFRLSNPEWLSITLAIAFEVGAAASLASIIALEKMNRGIVWSLFFILTIMQAMGNAYYAYTHLTNYTAWVELFGLVEEEPIFQKRILSIVSGAILPLVALGFIKSLVDYMKPGDITSTEAEILEPEEVNTEPKVAPERIIEKDMIDTIRKENIEKYIKQPDISKLPEINNQPDITELSEIGNPPIVTDDIENINDNNTITESDGEKKN